MRRVVLALLLIPLVLAVASKVVLDVSNSRTFQFVGDIVARVPTSERVVALTFDDGPNET